MRSNSKFMISGVDCAMKYIGSTLETNILTVNSIML